jgi:hypothetical protein
MSDKYPKRKLGPTLTRELTRDAKYMEHYAVALEKAEAEYAELVANVNNGKANREILFNALDSLKAARDNYDNYRGHKSGMWDWHTDVKLGRKTQIDALKKFADCAQARLEIVKHGDFNLRQKLDAKHDLSWARRELEYIASLWDAAERTFNRQARELGMIV